MGEETRIWKPICRIWTKLLTDGMQLKELFTKKNQRVLNVYCTAGYPYLDSTPEVIQSLQDAGVDIIEIGIPYSDPLADGPVIQESNTIALLNGMTISKLFEQLTEIKSLVRVPIVLMGYLNPILQYGFERFCKDASAVGVTGFIIPDIPIVEYRKEYSDMLTRNKLEFVFLVTPETNPERIKLLDSLSSGFLYAVSSSSITGTAKQSGHLSSYLQRLSSMQLSTPILVGFGIDSKERLEEVCEYVNGGIIGSAYIKALKGSDNIRIDTTRFISSIVNGAANGT